MIFLFSLLSYQNGDADSNSQNYVERRYYVCQLAHGNKHVIHGGYYEAGINLLYFYGARALGSWATPAAFSWYRAARPYPKHLTWSHGERTSVANIWPSLELRCANFKSPLLGDYDLILTIVGHTQNQEGRKEGREGWREGKERKSKTHSTPRRIISESVCL